MKNRLTLDIGGRSVRNLLRFILFCLIFMMFSFGKAAENNEQIEEGFVTFATASYFPLMEVAIASVHAFSTRPIVVYGIDADVPFDTNKYPRMIKRRINKPKDMNIYFQKLNAIIQSNIKYGIYIESDDVVNYCIDDLFSWCHKVGEYPLCPIHPEDPNNQHSLMGQLGVSHKTNPYIHAHMVFSYKCIPFLKECYKLAPQLNHMGASWDETLLNVMLWKYGVSDYYLPAYDPYFANITHYLDGTQPSTYPVPVEYYMFHGCKDPKQALEILEVLKQNVGAPIRPYKTETP